MLHDPPQCMINNIYYLELMIIVNNFIINFFKGGVFHETIVSFITFKVYIFKLSNLLCWKEESLRQPVM